MLSKTLALCLAVMFVFGFVSQPIALAADEQAPAAPVADAPAAMPAAPAEPVVAGDTAVNNAMDDNAEDPDITTLKKVVDQLKKDNHPELAAEVEKVIENLSW